MNLIDDTLLLLRKLINTHPFYGTQGIEDAQTLIYNELLSNPRWKKIIKDKYTADEIKFDPEYVDVKTFGNIYSDYENVGKTNIIAIADDNIPGPTLILNGHVDVDIVDYTKEWKFPEGWKSGAVLDDKIYGRGATDMLGGLTCQLMVSNAFLKNYTKLKGRIIFCSLCDEEIGGNGTLRSLHLLDKMDYLSNKQTYTIIAEPSESKVCLESLGFLNFKIYFKRTPVHMGVAQQKNNAVYDLLSLITNFENSLIYVLKNIEKINCIEKIKYNFGQVSGGLDSAIPIGDIFLSGTIFYPDSICVEDLFKNLKKYLEKIYPVTVNKGQFGFSGASFLASKFSTTLSNFTHIFPSPCDARLYKKYGIPTIIWGPGSLEQAHSVDEFIEISDLHSYANSLYKALVLFHG